MASAWEIREALRQNFIACEGSSSTQLRRFEVLEARDNFERIRPGTLVFLMESYGNDQWEKCHRICLELEKKKCVPLVRAESVPENSLRIPVNQPLYPVLKILEELFLMSGGHRLFQLLARGGSLEELVEILGRELTHGAFLEIPGRNAIVSSPSESFSRQIRQLPLHELLGIYPHRAIQADGAIAGYLFCYPDEEPSWESFFDHAAAVLAVLLERRQGGRRSEGRRKEELLRRLLFATESERQNLNRNDLRELPDDPSAVLVCAFPSAKASAQMQKNLQEQFQSFFANSPVTWLEGRLVAMIRQERDLRQRLSRLMEDPQWQHCQSGVGHFRDDPRDLSQSYHEALRALKLATELPGSPAMLLWEDCDLQSLLLPLLSREETSAFIRRHLGPLLQEPELLHTLEMLILCGWKQAWAAKRLSIHYNTLRYRIERINQLLGSEVQESEGKSITIALELLKLSKTLPTGAPTFSSGEHSQHRL